MVGRRAQAPPPGRRSDDRRCCSGARGRAAEPKRPVLAARTERCGTTGIGYYKTYRYGMRWFGDFQGAVADARGRSASTSVLVSVKAMRFELVSPNNCGTATVSS